MLKAEFKKTWSRPLVFWAFLVVCLVQVLNVVMNFSIDTKRTTETYNDIGGQMDAIWKNDICMQYEKLCDNAPEAVEDIWLATDEQRAVLMAFEYVHFTDLLDNYVASLDDIYEETAHSAYSKLRTASENGELVFGVSVAGEYMTDQYMITWGFLIFMILLCIDQFSGERETGMEAMQRVTKYGRGELFWAKLMTCQLSAIIVWVTSNLVYATTLSICYGWGNLQSVIQDFSLNACPYNWNTGQYMMVVLLIGLVVSQVTALLIFLMAKFGRTAQRSFALMGGVLVLPYLLAFLVDSVWIAMWVPCLMNNNWLWNGLRMIQFGDICIPLWSIAGVEIILAVAIIGMWLRRMNNIMEKDER